MGSCLDLHRPAMLLMTHAVQVTEVRPPCGNICNKMPPVLLEGRVGQDYGPEAWGRDKLPGAFAGTPPTPDPSPRWGKGREFTRVTAVVVDLDLALLCNL